MKGFDIDNGLNNWINEHFNNTNFLNIFKTGQIAIFMDKHRCSNFFGQESNSSNFI